MTNQATRIIVRAVGELGIPPETQLSEVCQACPSEAEEEPEPVHKNVGSGTDEAARINYQSYAPKIEGKEWILSETDLCLLVIQCLAVADIPASVHRERMLYPWNCRYFMRHHILI